MHVSNLTTLIGKAWHPVCRRESLVQVNGDRTDQEAAEERVLTQAVLEVSDVLGLEEQLANTQIKTAQ